jgi:hypothetical protein
MKTAQSKRRLNRTQREVDEKDGILPATQLEITPKVLANDSPGLFQPWVVRWKWFNSEGVSREPNTFSVFIFGFGLPRVEATLGCH